jgi:hypothetical protein
MGQLIIWCFRRKTETSSEENRVLVGTIRTYSLGTAGTIIIWR